MVGWHHQLNRHEFEQALGVGDGQGSLACCSHGVAKANSSIFQGVHITCGCQGGLHSQGTSPVRCPQLVPPRNEHLCQASPETESPSPGHLDE